MVISENYFFTIKICSRESNYILFSRKQKFFSRIGKIFSHLKNIFCNNFFFSHEKYSLIPPSSITLGNQSGPHWLRFGLPAKDALIWVPPNAFLPGYYTICVVYKGKNVKKTFKRSKLAKYLYGRSILMAKNENWTFHSGRRHVDFYRFCSHFFDF